MGELPVKDLGYIRLNRVPASLDITARAITAPQYHYTFEHAASVEVNPLIKWLASRQSVDPTTIENAYLKLVNGLTQIKSTMPVEWRGIGNWKKNEAAQLVFEPAILTQFQVDAIPAEKVIRSNATHIIQVGEQQSDSIEMTKRLSQNKNKFAYSGLVTGIAFFLFLGILTGLLLWCKLLPASFSNPSKIVPQTSTIQYRNL